MTTRSVQAEYLRAVHRRSSPVKCQARCWRTRDTRPTVNFEDTAYSNDYWISQDRLVEYKDKIDEHVARPEVTIDESAPAQPSLQANTAAQAAVKTNPAPPKKPAVVPKKAPAPSPDKKPVKENPEEAEQAMKNTAKEVTKRIDEFQKKIARQNAASMGKIPDNVKKGK